MVTKERKMVTIKEAEKIYKEANGNVEAATKKLHSLPKRQPKPPAPEGGIGIREAGRKYKIDHTTLWHWVKRGYIPILLKTKNETYIDEESAKNIIQAYKNSSGKGKWTIKKIMEEINSLHA